MPVCLHLCCRDSNANWTGTVDALELWVEGVMELRMVGRPLQAVLHTEAYLIHVDHLELHWLRHKAYVGNLLWDSFVVTENQASSFCTALLEREDWGWDQVSGRLGLEIVDNHELGAPRCSF